MKLKAKILNWSAGRPVSIISKKTAEKLNININDRLLLKLNSLEIVSVIDIAERILSDEEIIVSDEIVEKLNIKSGSLVGIHYSQKPFSTVLIKKKLDGKILTKDEISKIISDIVSNSLTEVEIAFFVSAVYKNKLTFDETLHLIDAMTNIGEKLNLHKKIVADKHSIGGIAGNRTTPLIVSICASAGVVIPKTSSRAITSSAGTADVVETLTNVSLNYKEIEKVINKTNACLVWGGAINLAPADDKIIRVEKVLNLDPESQLLASIMSKKLSMGSTHILIDIPFGKSAKVTKEKAVKLSKKFEKIAKHFKLKLECVLTDGNQPIGNGIGAGLEMVDILKILNQESDRPLDLEQKSIFLSGKLLELVGKSKKGQGEKLAKEILYSGMALKKFKEIIEAQGGRIRKLELGKFKKDILSNKSGKIFEIDNHSINSLARFAGSPVDKSAGVYIHKKVGVRVSKGERLLTIYSESQDKLEDALNFYKNSVAVKVK